MTRLSCHRFRSHEVRLWLSVIACSDGSSRLNSPAEFACERLCHLVDVGARLPESRSIGHNAVPLNSGRTSPCKYALPPEPLLARAAPAEFSRAQAFLLPRSEEHTSELQSL